MLAWIWLTTAILFEVAGTVSLRLSEGMTRIIPVLCTIVFYTCSFILLSWSLKTIPVGVSYAVWSGFGTALIATIGVLFFGEALTVVRIICIFLIVVGAVGLNVSANSH